MTLERSSPSPQESVSQTTRCWWAVASVTLFSLKWSQESEDQHSCSSYEGFVTREGCAVCLSPRPGASVGKHGGNHAQPPSQLLFMPWFATTHIPFNVITTLLPHTCTCVLHACHLRTESLRIVAHLKSMVKLMRPQDTLKLVWSCIIPLLFYSLIFLLVWVCCI